MSLLGAPNNAGARAALIADMAAAAASVGVGGADGALNSNPAPTSLALPAKARDSDLPAAGLWRADGTICDNAAAGGPAALLFVPRPPANIHHALKRQRRLLSPKDVPRLWTLPRIAAELILALADQAVREDRRARDAKPSPSHGPASGELYDPAAQVYVVINATAGGEPAAPSATGSREARDRAGNPGPVLLAPDAAGGLPHVLSTPPAQSGRSCGCTSAAASGVPAQGVEPAGPAPRPADAGAPSPSDAPSSVNSAGTGSQPRSAAAAGTAAAGCASSQGVDPQGGAGGTLHVSPAATSGPGEAGDGVAQQLARLVRGGIGAADVATADALVLEVRA